MSVLKSEIKQLVTHEVGVRVEDALEASKKELSVLEGRQTAFADGAKALEALLVAVDKDIEEAKYDAAVGAHVKRYVLRSVHALNNLSANAANLRIAQTGKVQAFGHTISLLQNMIEAEKSKAAAVIAAENLPPSENPRDRELGTRPENIKELRLSEEAPPPVAPPPVAPPPVAPPVVVAPPKVAPSVPQKKRRGRPPRASYT
jgi:hypothetical protein